MKLLDRLTFGFLVFTLLIGVLLKIINVLNIQNVYLAFAIIFVALGFAYIAVSKVNKLIKIRKEKINEN